MKAETGTLIAKIFKEEYTVTCFVVVVDFPFIDVQDDAWYYSMVKDCYDTVRITRTSEPTFSPIQEMTRAMVVTIAWRMEGQLKTGFIDKFSDVSSKQ